MEEDGTRQDPLVALVQRRSNWAISLAIASLLGFWFLAPVALVIGYRTLSAMHRYAIGFEHRGAATSAVAVGAVNTALFLLALSMDLAGV